MTDKLKPCPFCGGEAKLIFKGFNMYSVECQGCTMGTGIDFVVDVVSAWNQRKPMDRIVEQLELNAKLYSLSDKDCEFAIPQNVAIEIVEGGAE